MRTHVMLDLETLGIQVDSVILSIGAVKFNQQGNLDKFYKNIDIQSSLLEGCSVTGDTIKWWLGQSEEARTSLLDLQVSLRFALSSFKEWLKPGFPLIWGNGAAFDNVILNHAFLSVYKKPAWSYRNDRCYRTLSNLYPQIKFEYPDIPHNALSDATASCNHLIKIFDTHNLWDSENKL